MTKFNKRGQLFLLAAIVISVIAMGFGTITNYVTTTPEPKDLSDYSYSVKKEAGNVIDYQIYKNFQTNANLSAFIDLLAKEVRNKDPKINFMFIYGNNKSLTIRNYGSEGIKSCIKNICNYTAGGNSKIKSTVRFGGSSKKINGTYNHLRDNWEYHKTNLGKGANITITIRGKDFEFNIDNHQQIIFILQKETQDESFIIVR